MPIKIRDMYEHCSRCLPNYTQGKAAHPIIPIITRGLGTSKPAFSKEGLIFPPREGSDDNYHVIFSCSHNRGVTRRYYPASQAVFGTRSAGVGYLASCTGNDGSSVVPRLFGATYIEIDNVTSGNAIVTVNRYRVEDPSVVDTSREGGFRIYNPNTYDVKAKIRWCINTFTNDANSYFNPLVLRKENLEIPTFLENPHQDVWSKLSSDVIVTTPYTEYRSNRFDGQAYFGLGYVWSDWDYTVDVKFQYLQFSQEFSIHAGKETYFPLWSLRFGDDWYAIKDKIFGISDFLVQIDVRKV